MNEPLTPRTNTELFGHAEAEQLLLQGFESGKLARGWLLSGPRGIGKATLAYKFARTLFGNNEATNRRILAGSHSDLLVVEQAWDEKKEEYKNDISVDQAREIAQFLSLTPGEGQWRLVIVDSADALNTQAANAILKILEEPPPQAILLLISHNPGRLLPTIRSRCRQLRLHPLSQADFRKTMRHIAPATDGDEMKLLAQLSSFSPGVALMLQGQGAGVLYAQLLTLLEHLPELDALAIHRFADQLGTGKMHQNWHLFSQLVLALIQRVATLSSGLEIEPVMQEEGALLSKLAAFHPPAVWAAKWQEASDQFSLAERLHLDYKQVMIAFFHSITSSEGLQIGTAA